MSAQRCQLSTSSDHTSLRIVLFWTLSLRPTLSDIPTLLLIIELYRRMTQRSSSTYLSFSHWRSYYSVFPTTTWRCPSTLQMCVWACVCARVRACVQPATEKYLEILPPWQGIEPEPLRGQTVRYIHSLTDLLLPSRGENRGWHAFLLPLSYHDPGYGEDRQWDTFILPLSYHDPGHGGDRQWDTFILPLSYHDPGHGGDRQWDTFILPLTYHLECMRCWLMAGSQRTFKVTVLLMGSSTAQLIQTLMYALWQCHWQECMDRQ